MKPIFQCCRNCNFVSRLHFSFFQVNSFNDLYNEVPEESDDSIDIIVIILICTIVVSIIGIITTIVLILGVSKRSSYFFLPWLVWHMLEILGSVASGIVLQQSITNLSIRVEIWQLKLTTCTSTDCHLSAVINSKQKVMEVAAKNGQK